MHYLQDKLLAPAVRVRLASNAARELERIQAACATEADKPFSLLASKDLSTVLWRFLPADQGGGDTTQRAMRRFILNQVPWDTLPAVFKNEQLFPTKSALKEQVFNRFASHFISWTIPGSPRELLLRGRYSSAVEKLVSERDALRRQKEQRINAADLESQFQKWLEGATKAYARQVTAKSPQEKEQAERMVKFVWEDRNTSWPIHIIINSSAAVVRQVEVVYQLGLCSQEQAEQLQARLDLQGQAGTPPYQPEVEKARRAWRNALQNWQSFDEDAPPQHSDRPAARSLRARAETMLGDHEAALTSWKAVASWKQGSGAPTDLERVAASYLAQQGEKKHASKAK